MKRSISEESFERVFLYETSISSNVSKKAFEAGVGTSPIVAKQSGCLVDIPGSVRTNLNTGV